MYTFLNRYKLFILFFQGLICRECFSNTGLSVVLIGNHFDSLLKTIVYPYQSVTVSLLGIEVTDNLYNFYQKQNLYKLDKYNGALKLFPSKIFVFNEVEPSQLKLLLYKIYYSTWWNLQGYYFIKGTLKYCTGNSVYPYLKILWDFNILLATFVCRDLIGRVEFFTFNPFTNFAPNPWEVVHIDQQENGHPFTVFGFVYENGMNILMAL